MNEFPITRFINQMSSFHVHDFAVLFYMLGLQESSGLISPIAETGKLTTILDGMTQEEGRSAFNRLVQAGEIEWFEDDKMKGWVIKRFNQINDDIMKEGRRRYQRLAAAKYRERKESEVAA